MKRTVLNNLTENSIKNSFVTLLESHTFEEVTVKDICVGANINRVTFYKHYSDKYDLLDTIIDNAKDIIINDVGLRQTDQFNLNVFLQDCQRLVSSMIKYAFKYRVQFKHIGYEDSSLLVFMIQNKICKSIADSFEKINKIKKLKYQSESIAQIIVFGLGRVIIDNVFNSNGLSQEEIDNHCCTFLNDVLTGNIIFE